MSVERGLIGTREAAEILGVKPASLYAYVSRGLLARHRLPGERGSWFEPAAVDRLASRSRGAAGAAARTRRELRIESAVTTIEPDGHHYRGRSALALARTAHFERVAELLWTGTLPASQPRWTGDPAHRALGRAVQRVLPHRVLPFDRLRLVTAALASADPFRHDLRPEAVTRATRGLLVTLVDTLPARRPPAAHPRLAARLWDRLSTAAALLRGHRSRRRRRSSSSPITSSRARRCGCASPPRTAPTRTARSGGFGVLGGAAGARVARRRALLADVAGTGDPDGRDRARAPARASACRARPPAVPRRRSACDGPARPAAPRGSRSPRLRAGRACWPPPGRGGSGAERRSRVAAMAHVLELRAGPASDLRPRAHRRLGGPCARGVRAPVAASASAVYTGVRP